MRQRQPELPIDLYSDAAIADPYPLYRAIRDRGPAVWLSAHDAWAIGRFSDVRSALRADAVLVSGHGVAMNELVNGTASRVTLTTDGDVHRRLRKALMAPMMPSALPAVEAEIQQLADRLVADLLERDGFDGVVDFAQYLPLSVVARLVGLPDAGRQRMLDWAAAMFDVLGVMNDRGQRALPLVFQLAEYIGALQRGDLRPDGWAARLYAAADEGRIEPGDIAGMLIDYVAPSLDTTILATARLLHELGRCPDQWQLLRAEPTLVPRAIHEAIRLASPVRAFSRLAADDYVVEGTGIPAGDRVLVLYGSANRDERRYADPDRFDVRRDAKDHLGFGHGVHRCAGSYLAELEMDALLRAMVARVGRIEVGDPALAVNNVLCGYRSFRASFRRDG
ncbi:MAG: cytochrome P450 [Deltaproteobacteria bacterium]|nr:cytochrome P450 [Deltaproteobacteria bacterium]